jgi:glycogen(starch) synthase
MKLHIAFISYEFPPDTALGGIATYVDQAARMLANRGHEVEVFTASEKREGEEMAANVRVHRVRTSDRQAFPALIAAVFARRHSAEKFDILEGPDCNAEASNAAEMVPGVPLVVKLHTGIALIQQILFSTLSPAARMRKQLGAIRRRQTPIWSVNHPWHAIEKLHSRRADEIAAPCQSIVARSARAWGFNRSRVSCYPYPFLPSPNLLQIPAETELNTVSFVGRLEMRKGVIDLADAIPLVLAACPYAKFRFVGRPLASPMPGVDMRTFLQRRIGNRGDSVRFEEAVPHDRVSEVYAGSDVCVFPSLWENFPFVCLEAMSAARGTVATDNGGMAEMLDGGRCGKLVPPKSPLAIATAIIELLKDPRRRMEFGQSARQRVLDEYRPDRIADLQEYSYQRAIERRRH